MVYQGKARGSDESTGRVERRGAMLHEAWVISRVLSGWAMEKEHLSRARGSSSTCAILERLAGVEVRERAKAWHVMTAKYPTARELAGMVASADPLGPPPEEDRGREAEAREAPAPAPVQAPAREAGITAEDEGWGPIRLGEPPAAEPFPCGVFPPEFEAFCRLTAEAILAPVDYVGVAMLVTAGTAVGQSVNVQVKRGWTEAPLLYAVLVGAPGKVKTPALRAATRPLTALDQRLWDRSERDRDAWRDEEERRGGFAGGPPRRPEPPRLRAIVKDITRESLCLVLADNPRGVLCAPDEATAWVNSWNQYKAKGTDEQFWLSVYSGDPVRVDRKGGRESLDVPHPFCAVVGSIQPDLLADLRDDRGRDNGFLDRIVFAFPEVFPDRRWSETEVPEGCLGDWKGAIDRLPAVPMRDAGDGRREPWIAAFSAEARRRFIAWFNENGRAMDQLDARPGALSKAEARLARLALILSRLRLARDPRVTLLDPDDLGVPPVEAEDVDGAVRLDAYFASHMERALHHMNRGHQLDPDARALLEWIRRCRRREFKEKDLRKDVSRFRVDPDALLKAIRSLSTAGLIRTRRGNELDRPSGRKPSPAYDVHPNFHPDSTEAA